MSEADKLKKRRILPMMQAQTDPSEEFILENEGRHPKDDVDPGPLRDDIIAALKTVYDPEIPLNIYDLGLVYEVDVSDEGAAHVKMTLTAPGCPVAGSIVREVQDKVRHVEGVRHAKTELVWDPPWTQDRMTEAAKLELGLLF